MMTLDPSLNLDPNDPDHDFNWPLFVVPQEKVSVETIHRLSSNYYQGTEYDLTHTLAAGPFGNPLYPAMDRSINCYRCTYIQIANVKAYLPEEVRCLAYFGWGAPDSTYLTPVFASQKSLPEQFGIGMRNQYDEKSGWWLSSEVQQLCTINYVNAIEDLHALRDPLMAKQYQNTALIQNMAAKMVKDGNKDAAIDLLTAYSTQQSLSWFADWKALKNQLTTTYMHSNKNMKTQKATEWWQENVTAKGLK
jgi:Dipeptidase